MSQALPLSGDTPASRLPASSATTITDPLTADRTATDAAADDAALSDLLRSNRARASGSLPDSLRRWLRPCASLELTVVLFSLSLFLVFAGTLAQWRKDIWEVVSTYFRVWFAFIEFNDLLPKSLFGDHRSIPGGLYFPGGWTIGLGLTINLLAAHLVRFTVQTKGQRLWAGLGTIVVGMLATWAVIEGGHSSDGMQGEPILPWSTLWVICKALLALVCLAGVALCAQLPTERRYERWFALPITGVLSVFSAWLWIQGDSFQLSASSMRILWQLTQGIIASGILLAGCFLAFKQRAGIVLLHGGIALLMVYEPLVYWSHHEGHMVIREGETVNFVSDIRTYELAVVDPSSPDHDKVVAIPKSHIVKDRLITHPDLPVDLKIVRLLPNSGLRVKGPVEPNEATVGAGLQMIAEELQINAGADSGGKVDNTAAYVQVLKKGTTDSLGTHLVSVEQSNRELPETITVDGKSYELWLRSARKYQPYSVHLKDVRADNYIGTATARNYSSDIRLLDPTRKVDKEIKIWMNNPLRFAGETFYQSDYIPGKPETTIFQVVSNSGWMVPYVSCMIVGTGMLAQFLITLSRFLKRRDRALEAAVQPASNTPSHPHATRTVSAPEFRGPAEDHKHKHRHADVPFTAEPAHAARKSPLDAWSAWWLPSLMALLTLASVTWFVLPKQSPESDFDLIGFGQIPIVYEGRAKPMDTLARNTLRVLSDSENFLDDKGHRQPAIRWLLDVISNSPEMDNHRVIRIQNPDVVQLLGLPRHKGWLYSISDLRPKFGELEKQFSLVQAAIKEKGAALLSPEQASLSQLQKRTQILMLMMAAWRIPDLPPFPSLEEFQADEAKARQKLMAISNVLATNAEELTRHKAPLAIPRDLGENRKTADGADAARFEWETYSVAWSKEFLKVQFSGQEPDAATSAWNQILTSWKKDEVKTFNTQVHDYQRMLAKEAIPQLDLHKAEFEAWFNQARLFFHAKMLYLTAMVLVLLSWMPRLQFLRRTAIAVTIATLLIHSVALISRIYISGRPPVTNLYSSAVFIGWGCVLLGLILETISRRGFAAIMAAAIGAATLQISDGLAADGDTFTVLSAVLDTQFWLSTHVVTIALGYATTLLAGCLGLAFVVAGMGTPLLNKDARKDLADMIYGTICFAMLFSFVGTVLGGLWADDSWGRFWGWDPKENGALIIVIWNALVLHARWGGMVKDRGLAILAMAGNIAVAWSWYGVNELGLGLHAYAGSESHVKQNLALFVVAQLAVILLANIPTRIWLSYRKEQSLAEET